MADSEEYVVFEDSQGNVVSNDPRWKAEKLLASMPKGVDPRDAELEELRAFKTAHEVAAAPNEFLGTADVEEPDDTDEVDGEHPYASVTGKDLSALAKDRGITIVKGMKAGDVRDALKAQDEANA